VSDWNERYSEKELEALRDIRELSEKAFNAPVNSKEELALFKAIMKYKDDPDLRFSVIDEIDLIILSKSQTILKND